MSVLLRGGHEGARQVPHLGVSGRPGEDAPGNVFEMAFDAVRASHHDGLANICQDYSSANAEVHTPLPMMLDIANYTASPRALRTLCAAPAVRKLLLYSLDHHRFTAGTPRPAAR
jgi:hypothetical protein